MNNISSNTSLYKTAQGRSSMFLAIKAIAKKKKKFIISQAFTCSAVPQSIIAAGFIPFWIDIELETFSIDIQKLKLSIDKYKNNFAAIFIQHTFGIVPRDYDALLEIANRNNIPVIEDRCHCNFLIDYFQQIKRTYYKRIIFCYSFENAKPINLGRGGLLIASNLTKEEISEIENNLNLFSKQSFASSILYASIAIAYNIFYKTSLYWPLLRIYRKMANLGIMPSNFNETISNFNYEKIGIIQNLLISFIVKIADEINNSKKVNLLNNLCGYFYKYFTKNRKRFPIYVDDKEEVLKFCVKNSIQVKDFFNTPIQPLNSNQYHLVNYYKKLCPNSEKASKHVISFDKVPSNSIFDKLKKITKEE